MVKAQPNKHVNARRDFFNKKTFVKKAKQTAPMFVFILILEQTTIVNLCAIVTLFVEGAIWNCLSVPS